MTQISYDHGVSSKKLIGETIGSFFDRTVETYREREALVVRHQNIRWNWGELGRRGREFVEQHYAKPLILSAFSSRLDALVAGR